MIYNNFNVGKCNYEQYRYVHVCFNCQQNHAVMTYIKPQTVRAMRSLGMRRPVRSPGIQHTSRSDPRDYPSGAAVRL